MGLLPQPCPPFLTVPVDDIFILLISSLTVIPEDIFHSKKRKCIQQALTNSPQYSCKSKNIS